MGQPRQITALTIIPISVGTTQVKPRREKGKQDIRAFQPSDVSVPTASQRLIRLSMETTCPLYQSRFKNLDLSALRKFYSLYGSKSGAKSCILTAKDRQGPLITGFACLTPPTSGTLTARFMR